MPYALALFFHLVGVISIFIGYETRTGRAGAEVNEDTRLVARRTEPSRLAMARSCRSRSSEARVRTLFVSACSYVGDKK